MEHTFKIEKELKITTENIVDCVLSCEAGGFDYWGELCSDEKDYEAARQRLAEREKADIVTIKQIDNEDKPNCYGAISPYDGLMWYLNEDEIEAVEKEVRDEL